MNFQAKSTEVTKVEADVVAVFAGSEEAKKVDTALSGMLTEVATSEDFEDKQGSTLLIHTHGKIAAKRVLIVGLGKDHLTIADVQMIAATIGRKAKGVAARRVAIALPKDVNAQPVVEGIRLGTYSFIKHKGEDERKKEKIIEEVLLLVSPGKLDATASGIARGQLVADAVCFARDLVNEPPSITTPAYLANVAKNLAKKHVSITAEILGPSEMEKLGMGALLGISRGSDEEPRFIKLVYDGGRRKTVALVGKGITFDTGGLSLKDSKNMETMKLDMAGAAAILGVFSVLPVLKPKMRVVGLISACENMPGPKAIKPGDVLTAMNGKTIEVLNTDAEGRVVLADAISYAAEKIKPDVMIDLATLTGACMIALGEEVAGLFSNNADLSAKLKKSADASGEKLWELPLVKEYKEHLKSTVADVRNSTKTRYGGAINGALFLSEFVPEGTSWAHLDIAGPAFAEKDTSLNPLGGTGFGVRLLLQYLQEE